MPAPRATATPITNTNTNVATGRRIKTLYRRPSTAPPSTVTIVSVSNNLSPRMRVAALILRYPRVFCGIDTSPARRSLQDYSLATDRPDRGAVLAREIGTELRGIRPGVGLPTGSAEWNQETADRVGSQARPMAPLRQYARTHLQPYVVATKSRGHACDAQSDAGCCGIHDEIAEPCMTPRNPSLGKFDRTTEYHKASRQSKRPIRVGNIKCRCRRQKNCEVFDVV